jgi:hypothetical protein
MICAEINQSEPRTAVGAEEAPGLLPLLLLLLQMADVPKALSTLQQIQARPDPKVFKQLQSSLLQLLQLKDTFRQLLGCSAGEEEEAVDGMASWATTVIANKVCACPSRSCRDYFQAHSLSPMLQ